MGGNAVWPGVEEGTGVLVVSDAGVAVAATPGSVEVPLCTPVLSMGAGVVGELVTCGRALAPGALKKPRIKASTAAKLPSIPTKRYTRFKRSVLPSDIPRLPGWSWCGRQPMQRASTPHNIYCSPNPNAVKSHKSLGSLHKWGLYGILAPWSLVDDLIQLPRTTSCATSFATTVA